MRIAVIGAGLSGLAAARALQRAGHDVVVYEKSRGPSGRASTRRAEHWQADHGAQYFTVREPAFQAVVDEWVAAGVAVLWAGRIRARPRQQTKLEEPHVLGVSQGLEVSESCNRYVGLPRMTAPASLWASELAVQTEQTVTGLGRVAGHWQIETREAGALPESFDAVVLAIPSPQALHFAAQLPRPWVDRLESIEFLPCWAVMAAFDSIPDLGFDGLFANHPDVSWVAWNQTKPGRPARPVAVIHASTAFTRAHLESTREEVVEKLCDFLRRLGAGDAVEATAHRWLYALSQEESGSVPQPRFLWAADQAIGLCGDYLASGRVEGAVLSGLDLAEAINAGSGT